MTLNQRWQRIHHWCEVRGIKQLYAFFRGCDPSMEEHYLHIGMVNRGTRPVTDTDEPWIKSMEQTIDAVNNVKR